MKIAILLPHFGVFGGVRRFLEIGNVLTERFYDVVAYQTDHRYQTGRMYDKSWFKCNFPRLLYTEPIEADIIITGDPNRRKAFGESRARKKIVYVIASEPCYIENYKKFRDCEFILNNLEVAHHFPGRQLVIGGVNTSHFYPRKERDWEASKLKVLFYGRFSKPSKNSLKILRELTRVSKLVEFDCFDNLDHQNVGIAVKHPTENELPDFYSDYHVFVSWEQVGGWSNTAAEATACGCALVTNGRNCLWAVNNKTAIVTDDIVNSVREFWDDRERLKLIAEAGQKEIQKYGWEKVCDRLELIFKQ